jgi:HlyD family secretion protein
MQGKTIPDALQVPATAILPADDGSTNVMLVSPDGTTKKQAVTVGIRTPDAVQIVSGISAGDTVVTQGGYGLDNGTKVMVGKPGSEGKD